MTDEEMKKEKERLDEYKKFTVEHSEEIKKYLKEVIDSLVDSQAVFTKNFLRNPIFFLEKTWKQKAIQVNKMYNEVLEYFMKNVNEVNHYSIENKKQLMNNWRKHVKKN